MAQKVIGVRRWAASLFTSLFALYNVYSGIVWASHYANAPICLLPIALYACTVFPSLILYRGVRMPIWQAIANLVAAVAIPFLVDSQTSVFAQGMNATWYVMGVATLMTVTAVRGHRAISVLGLVVLVTQVMVFGGPSAIAVTGLAGAIVFVLAGLAISSGINTAAIETQKYLAESQSSAEDAARLVAVRAERAERIQEILRGAEPALRQIASASQVFDEPQRKDFALIEAALRDQIRGRGILNDRLNLTIRSARERGVTVVVLDEGGMDSLDEQSQSNLKAMAADAIDKIDSGRVQLRSPRNESYHLTVVATRPGQAQPDLWLKL